MKNIKSIGFTVIELIIVIVIISVLSAIIAGYVNNYNRKAKIAGTKEQLGEIAKALMLYKGKYGCYPCCTSFEGEGGSLTCDCVGESDCIFSSGDSEGERTLQLLINENFLSDGKLVSIDPWNRGYTYVFNLDQGGTKTCSYIFSRGPDNENDMKDPDSGYPCPEIGESYDDDIIVNIETVDL